MKTSFNWQENLTPCTVYVHALTNVLCFHAWLIVCHTSWRVYQEYFWKEITSSKQIVSTEVWGDPLIQYAMMHEPSESWKILLPHKFKFYNYIKVFFFFFFWSCYNYMLLEETYYLYTGLPHHSRGLHSMKLPRM